MVTRVVRVCQPSVDSPSPSPPVPVPVPVPTSGVMIPATRSLNASMRAPISPSPLVARSPMPPASTTAASASRISVSSVSNTVLSSSSLALLRARASLTSVE